MIIVDIAIVVAFIVIVAVGSWQPEEKLSLPPQARVIIKNEISHYTCTVTTHSHCKHVEKSMHHFTLSHCKIECGQFYKSLRYML